MHGCNGWKSVSVSRTINETYRVESLNNHIHYTPSCCSWYHTDNLIFGNQYNMELYRWNITAKSCDISKLAKHTYNPRKKLKHIYIYKCVRIVIFSQIKTDFYIPAIQKGWNVVCQISAGYNDCLFSSKICAAWDPIKILTHPVFWGTRLNPGGRLNKKDGLTRYGDSHVKDKTS